VRGPSCAPGRKVLLRWFFSGGGAGEKIIWKGKGGRKNNPVAIFQPSSIRGKNKKLKGEDTLTIVSSLRPVKKKKRKGGPDLHWWIGGESEMRERGRVIYARDPLRGEGG